MALTATTAMWLHRLATGECMHERGAAELGAMEQEIVSLEAEVPEALFMSMRGFLNDNPSWDQYQLVSSALATFLYQNGSNDRAVAQHYLNGLFNRSES